MSTTAVIAVAAAVVVILVLGGFLFMAGRVLAELNRQLGAVIAAVGTVAAETEPVDAAVESINRDVGSVQALLSTLSERDPGGAGLLAEGETDELPEFKGSSQHRLVVRSVEVRRRPRRVSSIRGSCVVGC